MPAATAVLRANRHASASFCCWWVFNSDFIVRNFFALAFQCSANLTLFDFAVRHLFVFDCDEFHTSLRHPV
jgi:hypothetical protein